MEYIQYINSKYEKVIEYMLILDKVDMKERVLIEGKRDIEQW